MKNNRLSQIRFWKQAIIIGVIFILIIILFQFIVEVLRSGNVDRILQRLENGTWKKYVIGKLVVGSIYGSIMAFYFKRNAKKR